MTTLATNTPPSATPTGVVDTIVTVTGLTPEALAWTVLAIIVLAAGAYAVRRTATVLTTSSHVEPANSRLAREAAEARQAEAVRR